MPQRSGREMQAPLFVVELSCVSQCSAVNVERHIVALDVTDAMFINFDPIVVVL